MFKSSESIFVHYKAFKLLNQLSINIQFSGTEKFNSELKFNYLASKNFEARIQFSSIKFLAEKLEFYILAIKKLKKSNLIFKH